MNKTPNAPSAPPHEKLYDKHEAVAYLKSKGIEIAISTLFYHVYVSKNLTPGVKHYGRLMWSGSQLDEFIKRNPKPGFKQRDSNPSVTVAEWVATARHEAVNAGNAAYFRGALVSHVKRDFNNTRRYYISLDGQREPLEVWNNTRLDLKPIPNDSESGS